MKRPGILTIIRAPFFSSIIFPVIAGSLLAYRINGELFTIQFIVVLFIGIGLHLSTTLYNDIYDTRQGTDVINKHRNETSGGSGVLIDFPELMQPMLWTARIGLLVVFLLTIYLTTLIDSSLWIYLWVLVAISAFFSKYYTAPPIKLAYRGLGEVSVWLAYGPMAILIAAVAQNTGFHPQVLLLMPVTGLSTASILIAAQLIDLEADRPTGKHGVASRFGTKNTALLYNFVHFALIINIVLIAFTYPGNGWVFLISLIPYLFILPKAGNIILMHHDDPDKVKGAAKLTVMLHVAFSASLILTLSLYSVV